MEQLTPAIPAPSTLPARAVYRRCVDAIRRDVLIERVGQDKEFHFQNWVANRLEDAGLRYVVNGRNSYPDFILCDHPEGFEIKGLAHPGRWQNFDANSQVPQGSHAGRDVYYVFGRYPSQVQGSTYPVIDLVICHGDFLNPDSSYEHENVSHRGMGAYGDILLRDRKMYVPPTPYALATGLEGALTIILKEGEAVPEALKVVGRMNRQEAAQELVGYSFNLKTNNFEAIFAANPRADVVHRFVAYRMAGEPGDEVSLRSTGANESEGMLVA